ncbi:EscU/YscU/HrcU family type III secretion system export apparatus switch protein [Proteus mirabilis]|uniref:EscU/YscU/HrcU family type III secretion system export apparatus switch protein n=1 Tax=Proteus mirabilis TaxID=584 RepID=UPI00234BE001|nr:EscU/YscU/HrcU family type III secretion system export apparatus switch protein [Proteus mirabilis]MDC5886298.1 EscU/YscU/HrcU family type III secretion system export apparatus switch protein [Proteus mirabilis]MDC5903895.1 EscU/YscU/HrcU family type III secretion system export apparatus switch protein [Proteus mirabilis]MDC5907445.1 EscU/YscU/HrcU family type III secretion system export apparatus switch protein [Proteus mirabilis]MDC5921552.1 EscU/YscU/HrcU family type III secretion system 
MAEKTEKPTPKKLRDSAKKGQSFKSKDIISTCVYLTGVTILGFFTDLLDFMRFYQHLLQNPLELDITAFLHVLAQLFFMLLLPLCLGGAVAAIIPSLIQSKFILATEAIKLDFTKLDPIAGFKKLFGKKTLKDIAKTLLYLIIFISSCYLFVRLYTRDIFLVYRADLWIVIREWSGLTLRFICLFLLLSLLLLLIDTVAEFLLHLKDMKMEKHEVKQEYKDSEGNPQIKSARRQTHFEILSEETRAAVKESSVVLVNPTHIAIAIYFDPDQEILPLVAVRAANAQALAVKAYACEIGIPVVTDVRLARRIYQNYRLYECVARQELMDVMDVLIWLKQVEMAGIERTEEE